MHSSVSAVGLGLDAERATESAPERSRGGFGRLLRSELRLVLGRRRTQLLVLLLALVPVLVGTVVRVTRDSAYAGQGPGFIDRVSGNGLFLVVTALFLCLPLLLPLGVSIAAADAVAGEASAGTLRYLLVVPVGRGRLLLAKAIAALTLVVVAVALVTLVALLTGGIYFGFGDLDLLSGQTVGAGAGLARMLGVAAFVALSLTGLLAVGLFFSTLTEVPIGVIAATVVVSIVSNVLDSLPQLAAIHPYLLTHHWFDFAEFLRAEVSWSLLAQGMGVQAAWVVIFGSLAWARFTTADITS
ncbi:ABC transporter permease [Pseudactinotalea sp.]|uniref:ABC transporter permease n=1 Tax=Pseudactinotalea sp. TaxID=1926260 RepID=UPI003B3B30D2